MSECMECWERYKALWGSQMGKSPQWQIPYRRRAALRYDIVFTVAPRVSEQLCQATGQEEQNRFCP